MKYISICKEVIPLGFLFVFFPQKEVYFLSWPTGHFFFFLPGTQKFRNCFRKMGCITQRN